MRATLARVSGRLALLGLAAFLSLMGALLANVYTDVGLAEDEWLWTWIFIGLLGLLSAAVFGTLALITSKGDIAMGPRGRIGLGVLAVISVLALAFVAGGAVAGALVILIVPVVLYLSSRRGRRKTPDDQ